MNGFRVGSIFGFEISIDFSWFIIFFLILWSLSSGLFPAQYPDLSTSTHIIMGIVGTLLFFTSIIIHELSHALVAKTKGIPVEGITLFIFGGISRTRMDAERPGDEFQIAGVGPLTSIILALIFGGIWALGNTNNWSPAIIGVAQYLSYINIALAIFNLLPGFPLDGGRLFRSIVWKITGDLYKATKIASIGGQLMGYLLVALGVVQIFQGVVLGGFWLIFIGWFLSTAAQASFQQQFMRMGLEGVRARQAMTSHPETVSPDLTVQEIVNDYFMNRRYQAFPVVKDNKPVGLITLNQVKSVPPDQRDNMTVGQVMTPVENGVVVTPETKLMEVIERMQDSHTQRVLVTQNNTLEGIITASDITGWLRRSRELDQWKQASFPPGHGKTKA